MFRINVVSMGMTIHPSATSNDLNTAVLLCKAMLDDLFNAAHLDVVFSTELFKVRHAGHFAVLADNLDDGGCGSQSGHAAQVNRAFGLSRSGQDATFSRVEGIDVTGSNEITRQAVGIS